MTAPPDWTVHLAVIELGGHAAAHLAFEHATSRRAYWLTHPDDDALPAGELHHRIHEWVDQLAFPTGEEA